MYVIIFPCTYLSKSHAIPAHGSHDMSEMPSDMHFDAHSYTKVIRHDSAKINTNDVRRFHIYIRTWNIPEVSYVAGMDNFGKFVSIDGANVT